MVLPRKIEREDAASIYIDLDDIVHMNHMNDLLLKFINFQLDLNLRDFDEMRERFSDIAQILMMHMDKFNVKVNCRKVYALQRLKPEVFNPIPNFTEKPIPKGVFKGTYGGHGNEIIQVSYPNPDRLEGVKLTGDPNVPAGEITFYADLTKSIILSEEAQREALCDHLIQGIEELSYQVQLQKDSICPQPFLLPSDARTRMDEHTPKYKQCNYRFIGEGQIAHHNFENPSMISAHIVIFDENNFGVLFLELRSMSLFSRVKENLCAVHFDDIGTSNTSASNIGLSGTNITN